MKSKVAFYDTKTIVLNYFAESSADILPFARLHALFTFMCKELYEKKLLEMYEILYDPSADSVERTVVYSGGVLGFCGHGENIVLQTPGKIEVLATQYAVDDTIRDIIRKFVENEKKVVS